MPEIVRAQYAYVWGVVLFWRLQSLLGQVTPPSPPPSPPPPSPRPDHLTNQFFFRKILFISPPSLPVMGKGCIRDLHGRVSINTQHSLKVRGVKSTFYTSDWWSGLSSFLVTQQYLLILLIKNIFSCRLGSSLWTALRRRWGACKHSSAGSVRVNYTTHFTCRLGG